jgi:hypothetical protein
MQLATSSPIVTRDLSIVVIDVSHRTAIASVFIRNAAHEPRLPADDRLPVPLSIVLADVTGAAAPRKFIACC